MTAELEKAGTAAPRPELDWERDWQGRPRILPDPDWTPQTAPPGWVVDGVILPERPYTRVTTHAEALQDASALTRWKMRRAVLGMGRRPDYVTVAASLSAEDRDRDALDDLAEKALEAAGPNAADVGTALHAFTERIDRGEPLGHVPDQYRATVDAYARVVAHLTMVEWECRTVCDELECAGTPDRIGFCDLPDPDGVTDVLRIIDTKTGRVDYSAGKFSTQLAIYRRSKLYHPGTGRRVSLEAAHGAPVSHWGVIVHTPAGAGTAELLWIDLRHGDHGAELATRVRSWRAEARPERLLVPMLARPPRPATDDGTCRGRQQNGAPCGYKAKTKQEDPLTRQFCGRHQGQATDLERWLAENPEADPAAGQETVAAREPVQPASPPVLPRADLMFDGKFPNGVLTAPVGTTARSAEDGRLWMKAEREDAHGWELDRADRTATAERNVAAVLDAVADAVDGVEDEVPDDAGPDVGEDRCLTSGLFPSQCACPAHRGGTTPEEEAAEEPRPARELTVDPTLGQVLEGYPPESLAYAAEIDQWRNRTGAPEDHPDVRKAEAVHRAAVGTYALDPATEVNGNPRPSSGLSTPEDVQRADLAAMVGIRARIMAAPTERSLAIIWQQHSAEWTAEFTELAARRSVELAQEAARAKPGAALLSALETAPDEATLTRLWQQYGGSALWTGEATTLAQRRYEQLQFTGHL